MRNYRLMFAIIKNEDCTYYERNLLERFYRSGQKLKDSKQSKDQLSKEMGIQVREALILDGSFLLLVSGDTEFVYEIMN